MSEIERAIDRCICCGKPIPEGRQVCLDCEQMNSPVKPKPDKSEPNELVNFCAKKAITNLVAWKRTGKIEHLRRARDYLNYAVGR